MAPALALRVPSDEQWGEDLLAAFYASALGKRRRLAPGREWPDLPSMPGFVVGLEYLGERPYVEESIPESVYASAADHLDATFEDGTAAGESLDDVADVLREAAREDEEVSLDVECGPVAVCEFARERGYEVELRGGER
ncbi:hypothetical protein [Halospeciosus flavus]|uniref:Uncharacterized protein n=1 Tax=Halospeciosus flavus TaxID=3032283 RepID=A0ABD5Z7I8_9EURY|nr:hypothetical protein [Halospeciosus flavus]